MLHCLWGMTEHVLVEITKGIADFCRQSVACSLDNNEFYLTSREWCRPSWRCDAANDGHERQPVTSSRRRRRQYGARVYSLIRLQMSVLGASFSSCLYIDNAAPRRLRFHASLSCSKRVVLVVVMGCFGQHYDEGSGSRANCRSWCSCSSVEPL